MKVIPLLLLAAITSTLAETYIRGGNNHNEAQMETHERNLRPIRTLEETCTGTVAVVNNDNSSDETFLACETPNGKTYKISVVDSDWVKTKMNNGELKSGKTNLNMPGAMVDEMTGEIITRTPPGLVNKDKDKEKEKDRELRELASLGARSVLIVRVIARDGSTGFSESQLSDSVFNDPVCLVSQYDACSQGKLTFVKGASNGVTTVTVNSWTFFGDGSMRNAITDALNAKFSVSSPSQLANHVMYCLPAGTMDTIAYAYIGGWLSIYSNEWCTYVSSQMHEIGHNLNLAHSNEAGTYEDQTGMMGYSYSNNDLPKMCFNGAKLWQLGWFTGADDALEFNEGDLPVTLTLEGFVHPNNGLVDGKTKVVKINRSSSSDLYMVFNWKSLHNSQTQEAGNQVTVVEQGGEGNAYAESELRAKLSANGVYTYNDYFGSGKYVTITVNTISTADGTAGVTISSVPPPTPPPTTPPPTTPPPTTPPPTTPPPTTPPPTTPPPTTPPPTTPPPTTPPPTTPPPTTGEPVCNLTQLGQWCGSPADCCSGNCQGWWILKTCRA